MNKHIYLHRFFFEKDNPYYSLTMKQKFLLNVLLSLCDENGNVIVRRKIIQDIMNMERTTCRHLLKNLEVAGYLTRKSTEINVVLPEQLKHTEKILVDDELIYGKYKHLSPGAKVFYTYYRDQQKKYNVDCIQKKARDFIEPMGQTIMMNKRYYRELEKNGLLRGTNTPSGVIKTLYFLPISNPINM